MINYINYHCFRYQFKTKLYIFLIILLFCNRNCVMFIYNTEIMIMCTICEAFTLYILMAAALSWPAAARTKILMFYSASISLAWAAR